MDWRGKSFYRLLGFFFTGRPATSNAGLGCPGLWHICGCSWALCHVSLLLRFPPKTVVACSDCPDRGTSTGNCLLCVAAASSTPLHGVCALLVRKLDGVNAAGPFCRSEEHTSE